MKVADVGAVVRSYRKATGLSQQDLAALAGISRATLNYLESGRDIEIGASRLLALADLLGIGLTLPADVDRTRDERAVDRALRASGAKPKATRRALDESLATGRVPVGAESSVRTALAAFTPGERLALVRCVSATSGQPSKTVWRNAQVVAEILGETWAAAESAD